MSLSCSAVRSDYDYTVNGYTVDCAPRPMDGCDADSLCAADGRGVEGAGGRRSARTVLCSLDEPTYVPDTRRLSWYQPPCKPTRQIRYAEQPRRGPPEECEAWDERMGEEKDDVQRVQRPCRLQQQQQQVYRGQQGQRGRGGGGGGVRRPAQLSRVVRHPSREPPRVVADPAREPPFSVEHPAADEPPFVVQPQRNLPQYVREQLLLRQRGSPDTELAPAAAAAQLRSESPQPEPQPSWKHLWFRKLQLKRRDLLSVDDENGGDAPPAPQDPSAVASRLNAMPAHTARERIALEAIAQLATGLSLMFHSRTKSREGQNVTFNR